MNQTVFTAILARLNADATLMTLLGRTAADTPCYRAQRLSAISAPCVTLRANTESSDLFCGTDNAISTSLTGALLAENRASIQLDVWVSSSSSTMPCTGEDVDAIVNRIDILLLYNSANWIANTHGWRRASSSQQYEEDTGLWHNALRYEFWYLIKQGYGL